MITANFTTGITNLAITSNLYQWDYGQKLYITGLTLANTTAVHFGSDGGADTETRTGTNVGTNFVVDIPDSLLETSGLKVAYIYLTTVSSGKTTYKIRFGVEEREEPSDTVTPDQENNIDQLIAQTQAIIDVAKGDTGNGIDNITRTSGTGAAGTTDTYTVTYTDDTTDTFTVYNGANGTAATIAVGTVTTGAAGSSATVTNSGTSGAAIFDIAIPQGIEGNGITSITRTAGTGEAGTTDTYTITYDDATTKTYNVVNGANGVSVTYYLDGSTSIPTPLAGNLFDKEDITDAHYMDYIDSTVTEVSNALYCYFTLSVTGGSILKLASTNGATLFMPTGTKGLVFDSEGTYIQKLELEKAYSALANKKAFNLPSNAATVKINFVKAQIDYILMFFEASSVAYDNKISNLWLDKTVMRANDTPFIYNIFDTLNTYTILDGIYVRSDGLPTAAVTTYGSVMISATVGEVYEFDKFLPTGTSTFATAVTFHDVNGAFLSYTGGGQPLSVTVPENACYINFNFYQSEKASVTIKRTAVPTEVIKIRESALDSNNWNGLAWVSLGDSITYNGLWQPYIVNKFGLTHTNCGIGSTCVSGNESEELPKFWQDVRLDAVKAADPDVITILGGANDHSESFNHIIGTDAEFAAALESKDKDNFKGAYSYIIENLLTWKPTVKIVILTTMYAYLNIANTTTGLTFEDFANASKDVAEYYGLPCVDLYHEMGLNKITQDTLTADDIHPNAAGAERMAELIIAKFKEINPL